MNGLRSLISVALLSLALATGCKKADVSQREPMSAAKEGRTPERSFVEAAAVTSAGRSAPMLVSPESRNFIMRAAEANLLEVELGRLPFSRGVSPDVKAFGMRLVADHSQAYDELKQITAKKGIAVPTALSPMGRMMVERMAGSSGRAFDRAFAEHMVQDHERDLSEFRRASRELPDPELRAWAAKLVPVLESHLAQAKEVRASVER